MFYGIQCSVNFWRDQLSYMWSREGLKMLVTDGRTDCSTISQGDMQEMLLHLKMDLYLEMTTMILTYLQVAQSS